METEGGDEELSGKRTHLGEAETVSGLGFSLRSCEIKRKGIDSSSYHEEQVFMCPLIIYGMENQAHPLKGKVKE